MAGFAYLAVPQHLFPAMAVRLAELLHDDQDGGAGVAVAVPEGPPPPELDEALVKRIFEDSYDTHQKLLRTLAEHPDEWINYEQLSGLMGYDNARSLPGTLGAFGRRANHRYGGVWPFEAKEFNGVWHARMSSEVAAIIATL